MRHWLFSSCFVLLLVLPVHSQEVLQIGIEKTVVVEETIAINPATIPHRLDLTALPAYDPQYDAHRHVISYGQSALKNRVLFDYRLAYGIEDYDQHQGLNYTRLGQLTSVDIYSESGYPKRGYKYKYPSGELMDIIVYMSEDEAILYKPNGQFDIHWKGNYGYDLEGNILFRRRKIDLRQPNMTSQLPKI